MELCEKTLIYNRILEVITTRTRGENEWMGAQERFVEQDQRERESHGVVMAPVVKLRG